MRLKLAVALGAVAVLGGCHKSETKSGLIEAATMNDTAPTTSKPDLVVSANTVMEIGARTLSVGNLRVEQGAVLKVAANQGQWLILDVSGDAVIDGRIEFHDMRYSPSSIDAVAPDGTKLTFQFPATSQGGRGGRGGQCGGMGGQGANGTTAFGGGGGGGGFNGSYNDPHMRVGASATDYQGAVQYGRGGNGGRRASASNGGLIYLAVAGKLSGGGIIDLSGSRGADGARGDTGGNPTGAGGGGGGSPGGDGGYIRIRAQQIVSQPKIIANGGAGGSGGKSGAGRDCLGDSGDPGEQGSAGYYDISKR